MKIHGEWEITRVRNVLVQTVAGNFNEEGALARANELKVKVPGDGPWALLSNASNWDMGSADTLRIIAHTREWILSRGCAHIASVIPAGLRRSIHQGKTGALPPEVYRYFNDLDEACAWLTSLGFPITADEYPHRDFLQRTRID